MRSGAQNADCGPIAEGQTAVNILALDLALTTGWAAYSDGMIDSGIALFDVGRDESKGLRTIKLGKFLAEIHGNVGFDLIVFEQSHHRGGSATASAERFIGKLLEFCVLQGIEHKPVHTGTLKKFAAGRGNAGKADMIEAAANLGKRLPEFQRAADDFMARYNDWCDKAKPNKAQVEGSPFSDEADALCLLAYAQTELAAMAAEGAE